MIYFTAHIITTSLAAYIAEKMGKIHQIQCEMEVRKAAQQALNQVHQELARNKFKIIMMPIYIESVTLTPLIIHSFMEKFLTSIPAIFVQKKSSNRLGLALFGKKKLQGLQFTTRECSERLSAVKG